MAPPLSDARTRTFLPELGRATVGMQTSVTNVVEIEVPLNDGNTIETRFPTLTKATVPEGAVPEKSPPPEVVNENVASR